MSVEAIQVVSKKTGAKSYKFLVDDFAECAEGYCVACGTEAYGVEPDARGYDCESCGEPRVYGSEELLLLGRIVVKE